MPSNELAVFFLFKMKESSGDITTILAENQFLSHFDNINDLFYSVKQAKKKKKTFCQLVHFLIIANTDRKGKILLTTR